MAKHRPRQVMIVSLGCAKNLVDTEVMCGALAVAGYALTNLPDQADVLLINTCSFIADARQEAQDEIREGLRWRRLGRQRRLVVAGCLSQREGGGLASRFRGVDLVLGLDDVPRVGERLDALFAGQAPPPPADFALPSYLYSAASPRLQLTPRNYAYVKIAEGCEHLCTFCAIPAIRGRQRSRPADDVLTECRDLLASGVKELNFIAQDSSRYGVDLQPQSGLAALLQACEAELQGDFWLRVLYTHPRFFDDPLLETFRGARHLLPYVDMPLQHLASSVLKAMGRRVTEKQTRELLDRVRQRLPGCTVRTTFLVGFPGESEADFQLLLDYVKSYRFDRLGVFAFSPETGTPAAAMTAKRVPPEVAEERRRLLMEAQSEISLAHNQALVGQRLRVLVEGAAGNRTFVGRTAADAPEVDNLVQFAGPEDCLERGFVEVVVDGASEYDLTGQVG